jgi:DNA primase
MSYSREFIDKVRDANSLIDFLSDYTSFRRSSGGQAMGRCPLPGHSEKTPSFSVSEPKQVYHCFGCGKSGNIFDALRELKNLNFKESVEYLAAKAGISLPNTEPAVAAKERKALERRRQLLKVNELTSQYYAKSLSDLPKDHLVNSYLMGRGLTEELRKDFRIGYAADAWSNLSDALLAQKAPAEFIVELGLAKKRKTDNGLYDLFRHRIIFPILDHKGEVVGFGGRALTDEQMPKYLNSPESELFHKGQTFYGLHVTGPYIRELDAVIVVEGYMDLLGLYRAGIKNVVATLGTALTERHAQILKRFTKNVVVLFDGDEAGQRATERSLPILLQAGLIPRGLFLPNELDPDEFVAEHGAEALQALVTSSPELFVLVFEKKLESIEGGFTGAAAQKLKLLDAMTPFLEVIEDQRLRRLYAEALAARLAVDPQLIEKSTKSGIRPPSSEARKNIERAITQSSRPLVKETGSTERIKLTQVPKAELYLLNLALSSPERLNSIWTAEVVAEMLHPGVQRLFSVAYEEHRQNPNEFDKLTSYLMTLTEGGDNLGLHLGKNFQAMSVADLNKMQADCIQQVQDRFSKAKVKEIASELRSKSAQDQLKGLEQIVNMKKDRATELKNSNSKKKTES